MPRTRRDDAPDRQSLCSRGHASGYKAGSASVSAARRSTLSLEHRQVILGLFTPKLPVLGICEIAEGLQVSRSVAYHHVMTLVGLGYLKQAAARKYRVGRAQPMRSRPLGGIHCEQRARRG